MRWYTSDTHFWHHNIIKYCERPFATTEEMNAQMIERWNARVKPDDTVFHLGDFCFGDRNKIRDLRAQLNGRIILVRGNHDRSAKVMLDCGIDEVHEVYLLMEGDIPVFMRHKPLAQFNAWADQWNMQDSIHLHGHVHRSYWRRGRYINVGVDLNGHEPRTFEELMAIKGEPT